MKCSDGELNISPKPLQAFHPHNCNCKTSIEQRRIGAGYCSNVLPHGALRTYKTMKAHIYKYTRIE